jgi:hypothetical protein
LKLAIADPEAVLVPKDLCDPGDVRAQPQPFTEAEQLDGDVLDAGGTALPAAVLWARFGQGGGRHRSTP